MRPTIVYPAWGELLAHMYADGRSWYGCSTLEEGRTRLHTPDADNLAKIATETRKHTAQLRDVLPSMDLGYDLAPGFMWSMDRILAGDPECWMTLAESPERPLVRIGVDLTTSGVVSHDAIVRRGIAIATLVQLVELAGARVEVDLLAGLDPNAWCVYRIKDADQDLSIARLECCVTTPILARGCMYRYLRANCRSTGCWPYDRTALQSEYQVYFQSLHADDATVRFDDWMVEQLLACGVTSR